MNGAPDAQAWLDKASHDILAVTILRSATQSPFDVIAFLSQQAAEKSLKAFLVFNAQNPAKSHDLVELLRQCVSIDASLQSLASDCRLLTQYAVAPRYPDPTLVIVESDATTAAEAAERVHTQIRSRVAIP